MASTKNEDYQKNVELFVKHLNEADAIVVGAASGMSAAAGFRFYYERDEHFKKHLDEFRDKYGYDSSFGGLYYPYDTSEERWAFLARSICLILDSETGKPYYDFKEMLEGKNYHILTTNQDTQFNRLFPDEKISAIQGDWRYLQCSRPCHDMIYESSEVFHDLNEVIDEDLKIPSEMIPRCPVCGAEMEPWVRSRVFLEGEKYYDEHRKLNEFLKENAGMNILFLELGVGRMTPMFIQQPFWNLTYSIPGAFYITINPKDAILPEELEDKGLAIHEDIADVFEDALKIMKE